MPDEAIRHRAPTVGLAADREPAGLRQALVSGLVPRPLTRHVGPVPTFDAPPPRVKEWHDARGRLVARSTTEGAFHWMDIAGVGTFRFPVTVPDDLRPQVAVAPHPGATPADTEDFYLRTVMPIALQAYGLEALHASGVSFAGFGVVALCGRPTAGKSTLAFALAERGHAHVADDAVVFDPGSLRVLPLPTAARLRRRSAEHFGMPRKSQVFVSLAGWDEEAARPLPFGAAVFLERGADRLTLRRLDPRAAFNDLLAESYAFTMSDVDRKRALLSSYMGLASRLPVYRLSYPDGLEHLAEACDAVAALAGGERR